MKRIYLKVAVLALLALPLAACGSDDEPAPEPDVPAASAAAPATTAAPAEEAAMVEEEYSSSAAAEAEALSMLEEPPSLRPEPKEFPLVFYEGYGVNPQIPADEQPFSTFGLDADTASWYRQFVYLDRGARPNPDAIRAEEMINAFEAQCDESVSDGTVRLCVQGTENPFYLRDKYRLVRVAVETGRGFDRPVSYIVVLDRSGSMGNGDRWNVATSVLESLLDNLNPDDRFGLVSFDTTAQVEVHPEYPRRAQRRYDEAKSGSRWLHQRR